MKSQSLSAGSGMEEVRQSMVALPDDIVDEATTARIKRHMANLLYPVDMSSFARPENDEKFREQIIALQRQMGVPATGTLTSLQYHQLAEAARDIDDRRIGGLWPKTVRRLGDGWVSAAGTGSFGFYQGAPVNIARIDCVRDSGACDLYTAEFIPENPSLWLPTPEFYRVTAWEPARVVAKQEHGCGTSVMTVDIESQSVTISWEPTPGQSCGPKGLWELTWRLVDDANSVAWKFHQDKANKARPLVYEPARRLVAPVADYTPARHGGYCCTPWPCS
jgi:hypothetical protein